MKKFDFDVMYRFCNENGLFTNGSNEQYEKMFSLCRGGIDKKCLVTLLYICSDKEYREIYALVEKIFN